MEQRTLRQPKRHSTAVYRNEALQNRLYSQIVTLSAVNYTAPQPTPKKRATANPRYIYGPAIRDNGYPPFEVWYQPQPHKLTARKPLVERVIMLDECVSDVEVSLVYQRKYDFNAVEVYCDGCRVVGLRAAYGQPLRKPQRFAAVVANCNGKSFSTVYFETGQLLTVVI